MKKWTILLLTALLLLQIACSDTPRLSVEELTERSELQVEENLDQQEDFPAERPESTEPIQEEKSETKKEIEAEDPPVEAEKNEEPPVEPITPPTVQQPITQEPIQPIEPEPPLQEENTEQQPEQRPVTQKEIRAVWFSYFEFQTMLQGKTEHDFTKNISAAFDNVTAMGLNTVIVQVRPYADATYPSEYFPWSYLAAGVEGEAPGFDPLKIMVREAHNRGLQIEAWINPYRIRNTNYNKELSSGNVVHSYLKTGDAIEYGGGIYFDPASKKAQKLITDGVREIVENYGVDGIHFDDYFYPTTDEAFDKDSYAAYKESGGKLSLADWRRQNVNELVLAVYQTIHQADDTLRFGISPQGNLENNYNKQFIDVALWLSQPGYVDYICPQIYFGFENETSPYKETVKAWNSLIRLSSVDLLIGLAPYKVGLEDTWAGEGKNEWKQNSDLLSRMVVTAREEESYEGFVLFRYDSVFLPSASVQSQMNKEINNLKEVLK